MSIPARSTAPLITLTTDFGTASPYVAVMKGVILSRCPKVQLVDLSHDIPPQDVKHAAYFLRDAVPWFPAGTIHVVVVDPGVGTSRLPLCVQVQGQYLLCPDNGLWTLIGTPQPPVVHALTQQQYHLPVISHTFHGRDLFAPCAAALAQGASQHDLGPSLQDWVRLDTPAYVIADRSIQGEIVSIDHFGNLITNIPSRVITQPAQCVEIGTHRITTFVSTYGLARDHEIVALSSSSGYLEIAQVHGHAARAVAAVVGQKVVIHH